MFRVFWSVNLRGMKKSGLLGSAVNGVIQSKKNGPNGPAHDNVLNGKRSRYLVEVTIRAGVGAAVIAHQSAAAEDDSKKPSQSSIPSGAGPVTLLAGGLGALLLGLATATAVRHMMVGDVTRVFLAGRDQHGLALPLLAVPALGLTALAARSRGGAGLAGVAAWARSEPPPWGRGRWATCPTSETVGRSAVELPQNEFRRRVCAA
jgi:hypothetical protein